MRDEESSDIQHATTCSVTTVYMFHTSAVVSFKAKASSSPFLLTPLCNVDSQWPVVKQLRVKGYSGSSTSILSILHFLGLVYGHATGISICFLFIGICLRF